SSLPHVIFILADDMGYNDIGYAGDDFAALTPNLDALAAGGVRLGRYYTQQLCTPARAALLTGRYPFRTGMQCEVVQPTEPWGLPTEYALLPEHLQQLGYATHAIGKWHLGHAMADYLPQRRGFDTFYGYLTDHTDYDTHQNPEYGVLDFLHAVADGNGDGQCVDDQGGNYSVVLHTDRAIQILDAHRSGAGSSLDQPLFLYLAYAAPHYPLEYDAGIDYSPGANKLIYRPTSTTRTKHEQIGRLLDALDARGFLENYLLVFASDNGGCPGFGTSNYPLRGTKHYLWEGGTRARAFVAGSALSPSPASNAAYGGVFHVTDW
ncbi:unnamed protein product, partial [Phaeothamnion confervicola]